MIGTAISSAGLGGIAPLTLSALPELVGFVLFTAGGLLSSVALWRMLGGTTVQLQVVPIHSVKLAALGTVFFGCCTARGTRRKTMSTQAKAGTAPSGAAWAVVLTMEVLLLGVATLVAPDDYLPPALGGVATLFILAGACLIPEYKAVALSIAGVTAVASIVSAVAG